jgi:DnaJ family protein C protein 3
MMLFIRLAAVLAALFTFTDCYADDTTTQEVLASAGFTVTKPSGATEDLVARLFTTQDVATAAVVFCDEHGFRDSSTVLDVARQLQKNAQARGNAERTNKTHVLKSAGAYKKRAAEASADDRFDDAAADYVRASLRPGVDPQAAEKIASSLGHAMQDLKDHNAVLAKEAAELAAQLEREEAERISIDSTTRIKAENEADWMALESGERVLLEGLADKAAEIPVGPVVSFTLNQVGGEEEGAETRAVLRPGEDACAAAVRFCRAHGLTSTIKNLVDVAQHLGAVAGGGDRTLTGSSARAAAAVAARSNEDKIGAIQDLESLAREYIDTGFFAEGAACYLRLMTLRDAVWAEGAKDPLPQYEDLALRSVTKAVKMDAASKVYLREPAYYEEALAALKPMVDETGPRATTLSLMRARCFDKLGRWADASRVAGLSLTSWAGSSSNSGTGLWERGSPRMLMASIGATAATEMGDMEKVKKYYQLVLRAEPDQKEVSQQYKSLKSLLKLLKSADDLILKGYNHKALKVLDEALSSMRGMHMSSGTFRSTVLIKLCNANSQIKRHEEALLFCDQALGLRQAASGSTAFEDPAAVREALLARAEALSRDDDHDEALRDFKKALENAEASGVKDEPLMTLKRRIHEAQTAQRVWSQRRNHLSTLELPANLNQLSHEKQCSWIKKQHRKLARKWHPDKYRGNSERGSRKMREVSEAKKALSDQFKCK